MICVLELLDTTGTESAVSLTEYRYSHEESKTNSMPHNGFTNLMNRSTCFGHYYVHRQELATTQTAPTCGTSPWLWQVADLVHGCRFERPVGGKFHDEPVVGFTLFMSSTMHGPTLIKINTVVCEIK